MPARELQKCAVHRKAVARWVERQRCVDRGERDRSETHQERGGRLLVRDDIDLAGITGTYGSERGQPPFDPTTMTALLLYSYCCCIYSSRRIAKACGERMDFMSIVGLDTPDFHTVSDFRKRHLKALGRLFRQILQLCEQAGLVKLGLSRLMAPRSKPTHRSIRR